MTFAILIPALDEEGPLARVLADLPRAGEAVALPSAAAPTLLRIVVVDNGSRDRTAQVARAAGAEVVHEPRRGYGQACLAGLAYLRAEPPDVVVFLDADHSDDPRELPRLLAPIAAGQAQMVIGSRVLGKHEPGAFTPVQAFGNRLAAWLMKLMWGAMFTDLGPFRAIRWDALVRLGMRDRDYGWTVEMQTRALQHGLACEEVPVSYRRRRLGKSKVAGTVRGVVGASIKILFTLARVRMGG
ncbi:MAG: glycosyltransferase family 2 protein [Candidatus Eisenbacteria bacterium]